MRKNDGAVLAANSVGLVPQAAWIVVARGRALIEDVASLVALLVCQVPPAAGVERAVVSGGEKIATVAASVGIVIPFALLQSVAVAGGAGVVSVRATQEASAGVEHRALEGGGGVVQLPLAHGKVIALGLVVDERAEALAGADIGVPDALGVGRATSESLVTEVALLFTFVASAGVDLAHVGRHASAGELCLTIVVGALISYAVRDALRGGGVPHAVSVLVAAGDLAVAQAARAVALHLNRVVGEPGQRVDGVDPLAVLILGAGGGVASVLAAKRCAQSGP